MKNKQALRSAHVRGLLEKSRMPRNQVAVISGLSNPYIRLLEKGETARVAREKLISFAVALNLDLHQTDELLNVFDRANLTLDDIPNFIEMSKQVRLSSALLPLRDVFLIELMFLAIERVPGPHIVVNDRPTSSLRPLRHRTYSCRDMENIHPIHSVLMEAIGSERKRTLTSGLCRHPVECYIPRESLEQYILGAKDAVERDFRLRHVENMIRLMSENDHFRVLLIRETPSFLFSLKIPLKAQKETPKLAFIGKQIDFFMGKGSRRLAGFATDNQVIIENFKADIELLKQNVIKRYRDP